MLTETGNFQVHHGGAGTTAAGLKAAVNQCTFLEN